MSTMNMFVQIYCRKPTLEEMDALFALNTTHVAWGIDPSAAVDIELSREIVERARRRGVGTTILSYQPSIAAIERALGDIGADFVLIAAEHIGHGVDENDLPGLARALLPRTKLMMSVPVRRVGSRAPLDSIGMAERYQDFAGVLILDTQLDPEDGARCGCTGFTNNWDTCGEIVRRVGCPVMLAGGLTPHNVADAIRAVRPWGVDACSSLEHPDQTKNMATSDAFIRAANAAAVTS
jgi:phosphoribosylanthranilate isomerase